MHLFFFTYAINVLYDIEWILWYWT